MPMPPTFFAHSLRAAICGTLLTLAGASAQAQSLSLYLSPPGQQNTTRPGALVETFNSGRQKPIPASGNWAIGSYTATIVPTRTPTPSSAAQVGAGPETLNAGLYGGAGGTGQFLFIYTAPEKVRINLLPSVNVKYLGFWWQAGNSGNEIEVFDTSGHSMGTFTANSVFNLLNSSSPTDTVTALDGTPYPRRAYLGNPNLSPAATPNEPFAYINLRLENSSSSIGSIELRGNNFEVDNLAIAPVTNTDPKWVPLDQVLPFSPPTGSIGAKDDELVVTATSPPTGATGDVSTNDTKVPGATFKVEPGNTPSHGTVVMNPDGTYTYTPTAGFKGTDSFTYTLCKPAPNATVCVQASVEIKVVPEAADDTFRTSIDQPITQNVATNDVYPTGATFAKLTDPDPAHGIVGPVSNTGEFTFTPTAGFTGTATFNYQVCLPAPDATTCDDATVTIEILPAAAPTATSVGIMGTPQIGLPTNASYVYGDVNDDLEGTSTFRWVTSNTATATGGSTTSTARSYTPTAADKGKNLFFCVTPVAVTGTLLTGTEVCSPAKSITAAASSSASVQAIPSLSVWGMLGLSPLLIAAAGWTRRRSRQH